MKTFHSLHKLHNPAVELYHRLVNKCMCITHRLVSPRCNHGQFYDSSRNSRQCWFPTLGVAWEQILHGIVLKEKLLTDWLSVSHFLFFMQCCKDLNIMRPFCQPRVYKLWKQSTVVPIAPHPKTLNGYRMAACHIDFTSSESFERFEAQSIQPVIDWNLQTVVWRLLISYLHHWTLPNGACWEFCCIICWILDFFNNRIQKVRANGNVCGLTSTSLLS